ncbi:MAG TPA: MG2 domain-containing protein, partial [Flavisolibacter sp.]
MKFTKWFSLLVLFFLSSNLLFAQSTSYNRQWKTVDSLLQKRSLPKSALQEVKKIYSRAKSEGQDAQVIKALIYTIRLQQENREDNQLLAIAEVEKELSTAKEPTASLLRSLLANLYHTYFQNHRWQLYNRTATAGAPSADVATWTVADFHKKISALYLASLRNLDVLQKTSLEAFDPIIVKGNVRQLRPTLYDLLAHNALDYFSTGERDLAKPAAAFEVTDTAAFAPAAQFATHNFRTSDTGSLEYKALTVYQSLVRMHLQDAKKDALLDVDIQRIQFAKAKTTLPDKQARYAAALKELINRYGTHPGVAQAHYLLALQHEENATTYHPLKDTSGRFERLRARTILEKVVRDSGTKSEGWVNSYNLLQQIIAPSFSFELEKVNIPGEPFRALVKFKNLTTLQFQIIRATDDLKAAMSRGGDERFWPSLDKATALRTWSQQLPTTGDLQEHSVEVKVESLPAGDYILLLRDPSGQGKGRSAQLFHVSTISYVAEGNRFFVLHRATGKPLAGAAVTAYTRTYDYNSNQYTKKKSGNFKTDKNGAFRMAGSGREYAERLLEIRHGAEELFLNDLIYHYDYAEEERTGNEKDIKRLFFFTDRSIYRPGQTVHFKALALTTSKGGNTIAANYGTTIHLRDANDQLVDSMKLTTNEYGSVNGKFTLPPATLNGLFSLAEGRNGNRITFSVEEYKRPKFVVAFEKVKGTYKAGDTVKVEGTAKAYAGNNVDGAQVRYRVVRQSRFMYPWLMRRGWWPQTERMEISSGTTFTTGEGRFTVSFPALPDQKIARELDPVFDYRVYADVTDKGGETRSSEIMISAGYKSLILHLNLPARIAVDSFKSFYVRAENMNGQLQRSSIDISIAKLKEEQRLIRDRYWEEPDLFVMSKDEFITAFPNDEYSNERDMSTWAKLAPVFQKSDTTRSDGTYTLPYLQWQPGFYEVTVTGRDSNGLQVKDKRYIELYVPGSKGLQKPEYLWTSSSTPVEPDGKTGIEVGSSAKDVFLIQEVDKGVAAKEVKTSFSGISGERKRFTFEATEADRGGYGVTFFFVKDNRFYQFSDVISVPWSNKAMDIEFATFRDKMLPGSAEKWSVKIKGAKGERVAAEMLASM